MDEFGWLKVAPSLHGNNDESRAFFDEYGDYLLKKHIGETPGTRPYWWWFFYGPAEPVKVLGQVENPEKYQPTERRESQAAFMHRHGLLTKTEAELWDAGDLPKEEITRPANASFTSGAVFLAGNGLSDSLESPSSE